MVSALTWIDRVALAGFGDISDGVPELIGDGDESRKVMPPPPRVSRPIYDVDKTARIRRPK